MHQLWTLQTLCYLLQLVANPFGWKGKQRTESALAERNVQERPAQVVALAKQGKQRQTKRNSAKQCQAVSSRAKQDKQRQQSQAKLNNTEEKQATLNNAEHDKQRHAWQARPNKHK